VTSSSRHYLVQMNSALHRCSFGHGLRDGPPVHLNTCPVGMATQDETLRRPLAGKPEMVISYFQGVASEVRALLGRLGVNTLEEIVGHAGYLQPRNQESAAWVEDLLRPPSGPPILLG